MAFEHFEDNDGELRRQSYYFTHEEYAKRRIEDALKARFEPTPTQPIKPKPIIVQPELFERAKTYLSDTFANKVALTLTVHTDSRGDQRLLFNTDGEADGEKNASLTYKASLGRMNFVVKMGD